MSNEESKSHSIQVSDIGIPKEVMKDCSDPRDILRELISNAGAKEVGAREVEVFKFTDPEYGLSFRVKDDGCGMAYTGDKDNQGRLDRFLNLGYSEVSGLESDEYSHKGLGSALIYNSRRVKVESYDGNALYEVIIEDPRGHFWKEDPEAPTPRVSVHKGLDREDTGTNITIRGFAGGKNAHYKKYNFDRIKEYLRWRSLGGCTKKDRVDDLPQFKLNVENKKEVLEPGFPWIKDDASEDTVIFEPEMVKKEENGKSVKATVKGGMTLNTKEQELKDKYAGLTVSLNGIPYFRDISYVKSHFSDVHWKFMNLVIECDDLNLNISRNGYYKDDLTGELFNNAVNHALRNLENTDKYKQFAAHVRQIKRKNEADDLEKRKEDLKKNSHRYVTIGDEVLHSLPRSEQDTLAILWKLEGKGELPFYKFQTLEHTPQKGMDLIVDIQASSESERKNYVSVEVERDFSNFERHSHHPGHTDYVICWKMNRESIKGEVDKLSSYKYLYKSGEQAITVFVLEDIDSIEIRRLSEIK